MKLKNSFIFIIPNVFSASKANSKHALNPTNLNEMKGKNNILAITSLLSFSLLIIFSISQQYKANYLELHNKWLFISAAPIAVGILLSGLIKSFKGFGVELETNLSKTISTEVLDEGTIESDPVPAQTKGTNADLNKLIAEKKHIERLQFIYGKENYYDAHTMERYIKNLSNLQFIEIIDSERKFIGLLPVSIFKELPNQANPNFKRLLDGIVNKEIHEKFPNLITDTINKNELLLEAFKKFMDSKQGLLLSGDQVLPVVDNNHKMVGITSKMKLTEKIALQVVKSKT